MDKSVIKTVVDEGKITTQHITILKKAGIVPKDTPTERIIVFCHVCNSLKLNPFTREIYLLEYNKKGGGKSYAEIVGIGGHISIAERTGKYIGCSDAKFDLLSDGSFKTMFDYENGKMPKTVTVSAFKVIDGIKHETPATIIMSIYNNGKNRWYEDPIGMGVKVAKALALRTAFNISGVYSDAEEGSIKGEVGDIAFIDVEELKKELTASINSCETLEELALVYQSNSVNISELGLTDIAAAKKAELKNQYGNNG